MRVSIAAALACAAAAVADAHDDIDSIYQPSKGEIVQVGSTVEIKWKVLTKVDGPVNITLAGGADDGILKPVDILASGYDNSKLTYSWKVNPPAKEHKVYGINIILASDANVYAWSPPFAIKDEAALSSTSSIKSGDTASSLHTMTSTTAGSLSSHSSSSSTATYSTISAPTTASPTEQASATSDTNSAAKSTSSGGASALGAGSFAAVGGLVAALLAI